MKHFKQVLCWRSWWQCWSTWLTGGTTQRLWSGRQAKGFLDRKPLFHSGERSDQPAKGDCSCNVHVVGGAGEAEGGVEGAGLLGRSGGEGSLAESLLCLVQSDLIHVQDSSRHLHTYHSLCQNDHRNKKITVHSSLSPRPASQLEKRIQLPDYTGASPSTRVVKSLEKISLHQFFHMHRQLLSIVQTPTVLHTVLNKNQCALHLNLMRSDSQIYTYQSSIHAPVKYTRITRSNIHHSPKHTLIGTQRGKLVYFQQDR